MINQPAKEIFKAFHFVFKREYLLNSAEGLQRFKIFKENLITIKETNANNLSYKYGVNQFSDLTVEEFKSKLMKTEVLKAKIQSMKKGFLFDEYIDEEDTRNLVSTNSTIDWTSLLGAARDQGQCGDCWAFSSASAVEAAIQILSPSSTKTYLSPRQLVDCTASYGEDGCNGGWFDGALQYAQATGLVPDSVYPYKAVQGNCTIPKSATVTKIASYQSCEPCTFTQWMTLLQQGPISVALDATQLQLYASGTINFSPCGPINHAVLVVGWNSTVAGNVMKVRNSWGTSWGMAGYFYAFYNATGFTCGLSEYAFLPTVSTSPPPPPNPCFTPSTTFQSQNGWTFTNGQKGTLSFTANGPLQVQVFNNATKVVNHFTSFSGWNNTKTVIAKDAGYTQPLCSFNYSLNGTNSYNYTILYTNTGINTVVNNVQFPCNVTTANSASVTSFSIAGNGITNICYLTVTNN